jgi:hypothetical protein
VCAVRLRPLPSSRSRGPSTLSNPPWAESMVIRSAAHRADSAAARTALEGLARQLAYPTVLLRLLPVCCPTTKHGVTKTGGRILGSGLTCISMRWARQGLNL